jgi:Glycosyl transferase family 2
VNPTYRRAVSLAHRARDFLADRSWTPSWSRLEANPARPEVLDEIRLFAVLGVYNEDDIVEASVKNAFAQGAERVYVVDNASTDDTVARALSAGAILAKTYRTEHCEDRLRTMLMNSVVWDVSSAEDSEHIWWLWMDTDEFSHGPGNQTLVEFLGGLDRRFRTVGADFYQHFPHQKPEYLPGFHPLDFQPLCEPFWQEFRPRCAGGRHYKHPLARFDRAGPYLLAPNSFHSWRPNDDGQLVEPLTGVITHHFQYREEQATSERLIASYGPGSIRGTQSFRYGNTGGERRVRSLEALYSGRFDLVDNDRRIRGDVGVTLQPWDTISGGADPVRWYTEEELTAARLAAD